MANGMPEGMPQYQIIASGCSIRSGFRAEAQSQPLSGSPYIFMSQKPAAERSPVSSAAVYTVMPPMIFVIFSAVTFSPSASLQTKNVPLGRSTRSTSEKHP